VFSYNFEDFYIPGNIMPYKVRARDKNVNIK
jgi:hypothetical protein